jgi:hypothetical protein
VTSEARQTIGVEDSSGERGREPAPVAETRGRLSRLFGYVEDAVYIGLAVLLACVAVVLLGTSGVTFWRHLTAGDLVDNVVPLLDQLLLVLTPPFLLVALIAVVRRIVVLTAEAHKVLEKGEAAFRAAIIELALLTALSVGLAVCLYLLRARSSPGTPEPAAERTRKGR